MTDSPSSAVAPRWRGFHHVALLTHDLDATVYFYETLLEMTATSIVPLRQGRHCFIKPGQTDSWGIHFLETPDVLPPAPETLTTIPFTAVAHTAFTIADEDSALALRQRLVEAGVTVTDINEMGPIRNILFRDPNGHLLEATWDKVEG